MTSSGHIYKIICTLDEKFCYIGSTFNRLSKRFEGHRCSYKRWKEGDERACSCYPYFDKYGVENFKIILIKTYEVCRSHVKDRKHLEAYETLWINKSKCVNRQVPFNPLNKHKRYQSITRKMIYINEPEKHKAKRREYTESHRDELAVKNKEWREKNRVQLSLRRRQSYVKNCDKKKAIQRNYYAKNRVEMNLKQKEYRDKNRDEINAKQRECYAKKQAKKKAEKEAQITV